MDTASTSAPVTEKKFVGEGRHHLTKAELFCPGLGQAGVIRLGHLPLAEVRGGRLLIRDR